MLTALATEGKAFMVEVTLCHACVLTLSCCKNKNNNFILDRSPLWIPPPHKTGAIRAQNQR